MQIGEVIRAQRIAKNMTQEEMANRLGVTAPAVNKWENGKTLPDICLLAPIARLLEISLDTLLSFRENLTDEEINAYIQELDERLKKDEYKDCFAWGKSLIEKYPNCDMLKWQITTILEAHFLWQNIAEGEYFEGCIYKWYCAVLGSKDENIRRHAADSLFAYYVRNGDYEAAEECLKYYSEQNPERKRKLAELYQKSGRIEEAYKAYEELLFSYYAMTSMVFQSMCMLSVERNEMEDAHYYLEKQGNLAKLFEMGKYYEISGRLDVASVEDEGTAKEIARQLLECVDSITAFRDAKLYRHMTFREGKPGFIEELQEELYKNIREM